MPCVAWSSCPYHPMRVFAAVNQHMVVCLGCCALCSSLQEASAFSSRLLDSLSIQMQQPRLCRCLALNATQAMLCHPPRSDDTCIQRSSLSAAEQVLCSEILIYFCKCLVHDVEAATDCSNRLCLDMNLNDACADKEASIHCKA